MFPQPLIHSGTSPWTLVTLIIATAMVEAALERLLHQPLTQHPQVAHNIRKDRIIFFFKRAYESSWFRLFDLYIETAVASDEVCVYCGLN